MSGPAGAADEEYNAMGLRITRRADRTSAFTPAWAPQSAGAADAAAAVERAGVSRPPARPEPPTNALGLRVTGYSDGVRTGAAPLYRPQERTVDNYQGEEGLFERTNLHRQNMEATGIAKGTVRDARNAIFGSETSSQDVGDGLILHTSKRTDPPAFEFHLDNTGYRDRRVTMDLAGSRNLAISRPALEDGATSLDVIVRAGASRVFVCAAAPAEPGAVALACSVSVSSAADPPAAPARAGVAGAAPGETSKSKPLGDCAVLHTFTSKRPPGFRWELENTGRNDVEITLDLSGSTCVALAAPAAPGELRAVALVPAGERRQVAAAVVTRGRRVALRTAVSARELPPAAAKGGGASADDAKSAPAEGRRRAMYDYAPQRGDEVALRAGDEVQLRSEPSDGWAHVLNATSGESGLAPCNHLGPAGAAPRETRGEKWASDGGRVNRVLHGGRQWLLLGQAGGVAQLQAMDNREMREVPVDQIRMPNLETVRTTATAEGQVREAAAPAEQRVEAEVTFTPDAGERRLMPGIRVDARTGEVRDAVVPGRGASAVEKLRAGLSTRDKSAVPRAFR